MSQKITAYKGKVKHRGLVDFGSLYNFLYDYYLDEDFDPQENMYYEKNKGDVKEVEIDWEATKNISDYFAMKLTAFWIILGMKDVEVERDGKKVKMQSAVVEISVSGVLIKDPQGIWEKNRFWKFLRKMYDSYIIKKRIEQYEELVIEETVDFLNYTRSILAIEPVLEGRKSTVFV